MLEHLLSSSIRPRHAVGIGLTVAMAFASLHNSARAASPWMLDDFSSPSGGWTQTATGPLDSAPASFYRCEQGLPDTPGGARMVYHAIYNNPLDSVSAVAVGNGRLSVAQGTGTMAETLIMYGSFARVVDASGGCDLTTSALPMARDLSDMRSLRLTFSGSETGLNLNVTYYTRAPLDPAVPIYYTGVGINAAPSAPGAPMEVTLPVSHDPAFNWRQVDGIVIVVNRSGPIPHTSYTLDRLEVLP